MKIAVCGSGTQVFQNIAEKAFIIGRLLARKNVLVLTGAGLGYPYYAAKGAFSDSGTVVGISPAESKEEHIAKYKFMTDAFTSIEYTSMGIPGRNYALIKEADAVIIIGGQIGTLNEFSIAFHENKPIAVLKESGGITSLIPNIAEICDTSKQNTIIYEAEPEMLVEKIIAAISHS